MQGKRLAKKTLKHSIECFNSVAVIDIDLPAFVQTLPCVVLADH